MYENLKELPSLGETLGKYTKALKKGTLFAAKFS
jgi:hypothetical protein